MKLRAFKCKSCGAGLLFDFSSLSITCPYCGTAHVLERDDGEGADADVLPKGIIP